MKNPLLDSTSVLAASVALGLLLPEAGIKAQFLIAPALFIMMVFSMKDIPMSLPRPSYAVAGFIVNYVILSGLILALSFLTDGPSRLGLVVMAAVPPAVAVLPLTRILRGDTVIALHSEVLCYIASPLIMTVIIAAFCGGSEAWFSQILQTSVLLILLPIALSRLLKHSPLRELDPSIPINAALFIVTYIVIAASGEGLDASASYLNASIAISRTFLIGAAVYAATMAFDMKRKQRIAYTVLSSFKNMGLAATVAVQLFGPAAGAPAAYCIIAETAFFLLLSALAGRRMI